jgi:hypothetical protein
MTTYLSATKGVPVTLQSGATTGNGVALAIPSSFKSHKINIKGLATVSAGAVQPESADDPSYSGTWNPLGGGPITVVDVSELEYNFVGIFSALRCRISTNIVGGTVTVTYVGS